MPAPSIVREKNTLAIWSLVCGIGGLLLAVWGLVCGVSGFQTGLLTGLAAIITGHLALVKVRRDGSMMGGSVMARSGLVLGYLTTAGGLILVTVPTFFVTMRRARITEALKDARAVRYAMDAYAADHNGTYPKAAAGSSDAWSNDYFRQLILSGELASERIFWVKKSPVAAKAPPDDIISTSAGMAASEILKAGDVHWAYVTGQHVSSPAGRPLLLDPYIRGTTAFDPDLWARKVLVMRIDGNLKLMRMRLSDGKVVDGSNRDILSPHADAWKGSGEDPAALLKQPEPR